MLNTFQNAPSVASSGSGRGQRSARQGAQGAGATAPLNPVLLQSGCTHLQVEWTQELHERFVNAVETLGADKAVPSKILEHMGPIAAGLTRQNVASHLQKHRTRRRSQNDFCKAAPYCPPAAYHCWSPFSPPGAMIGALFLLSSTLQ